MRPQEAKTDNMTRQQRSGGGGVYCQPVALCYVCSAAADSVVLPARHAHCYWWRCNKPRQLHQIGATTTTAAARMLLLDAGLLC
jgi:hypothetical protein